MAEMLYPKYMTGASRLTMEISVDVEKFRKHVKILDAQGQTHGILNDDQIIHMTPSVGRLSGESSTLTDFVYILRNIQFVVL